MVKLASLMDRTSDSIDALGPEDSAYDALECGQLGVSMRNLTRMLDGICGPR